MRRRTGWPVLPVFYMIWFPFFAKAQVCVQQIALRPGWNAFYLKVTPRESPDDFFRDWPVDTVSVYEPDALLKTARYVSSLQDETPTPHAFSTWVRNQPSISSMKQVQGNRIYLCNNAEDAVFPIMVKGVPVVPSMRWRRVADGADILNYFGLSLPEGVSVRADAYLAGCDAQVTARYILSSDANGDPKLLRLMGSMMLKDGDVIVTDSAKYSDWPGVIDMAQKNGIHFRENESELELTLTNRGGTRRTFRLELISVQPDSGELPLDGLLYFDGESGDWRPLDPLDIGLDPGERRTVRLSAGHLDPVSGGRYAGVVQVTDTNGGSLMQVWAPVTVTMPEYTLRNAAWPSGLWVGNAVFDKATYVAKDGWDMDDVTTGGTAKVRFLMHVDNAGHMTLLQRVVADSVPDGSGGVALYAPDSAEVSGSVILRMSAVCFPVDMGRVAAGAGSRFGEQSDFTFILGQHSGSNPFRHALHPDHDGLNAFYRDPAPDGDVQANYMGTVKPELFSVTNRFTLIWGALSGPEEQSSARMRQRDTLSGTVNWEAAGLRASGAIRTKGRFSMRRIYPVAILED